MRNLRLLCLLGAMLLAAPVSAITIDGVTINLGVGATNSADTAAGNFANTSSISIIDSGGTTADTVGATTVAQGRYAANSWVDICCLFNETAIRNHSYDLNLTISASAGTIYDLTVESVFEGLLKRFDDSTWGYGEASVGAVTVGMTVNGVSAVNSLGSGGFNLAYDWTNAETVISSFGSHSLTGLDGTTELGFSVVWSSSLESDDDEVALLLGLDEANGPMGGVGVGEYDQTSRTAADDGHFIKVTSTVTSVSVIPEPSTGLLTAFGLAAFAAIRRPRAS